MPFLTRFTCSEHCSEQREMVYVLQNWSSTKVRKIYPQTFSAFGYLFQGDEHFVPFLTPL